MTGSEVCRHGVPYGTCGRYVCTVDGFMVNPYSTPTRLTGKAPKTRAPVENRTVMRDDRGLPITQVKDGRPTTITRKEWWQDSTLRKRYREVKQGN